MTEGKDKTQRRVYVLPTELVDRIVTYQQVLGLPSEVEAVRRLLDNALKQRDDFISITTKVIEKNRELKSLRDAAKEVLIDHPLVSSISFGDDFLKFTLSNNFSIQVDSWNTATVYNEYDNIYDFDDHLDPVPEWASEHHPRPKRQEHARPASKPNYDLDDDIPF